MTATFNSRLLKCKDFVQLRSRCRKLQTKVRNSETRLTTLEQNHQSIVEHYNERMKRLSTKLKGFQGELHACNNRIKILEQKLLLTNVHVEPIQGGCPDFTETGSCSDDDLQLHKVHDEAAATTDEPKRPEIDPKKMKEVKIIVERNILKPNSTTSDEQENTLGEADKESPDSNSDPDRSPLGDSNTAETDSLLPDDIKPIICPTCQMAIGSETDLQNHTKSHLLLLECVLCDACFSVQEDFEKHIIEIHAPARKTLACSKCDLTFKNKYSLRRHNIKFQNVHSGTDFICTICIENFRSKELLKNHLAIHSGKRPFSCSKCPRSFCRKSTLKKHVTSHSSDSTTKQVHPCELCPTTFITRGNLQKHLLKIHGKFDPKYLFSCSKCTTSFSLRSDLKNHLTSHSRDSTTERVQTCELCPTKFIYRRSLQKHLLKIHGKSDPKNLFSCSVEGCECEFHRKAHLSAHLVQHRNKSNHEDKLGSQDYCLARYTLRKQGKEHDKSQPSVTPGQDLSRRVSGCQI